VVVAQQHGLLPYVMAMVAALSVGDPFLTEQSLNDDLGNDDDSDDVHAQEANQLHNPEAALKAKRSNARRNYYATIKASLLVHS
jgi:ATP-dependent RNA helicase DHX37/DHR1